MSNFLPKTILDRNESKDDPYDKIRVLADSPTKDATLDGLEGTDGDCVLVEPLAGFGSVVIAPVQALNEEYSITEYPSDDEPAPIRPGRQRLVTPEAAFAAAAEKTKKSSSEPSPYR